MDLTSQMGALKRAYAEIILNVTKASAERVLAAERRALSLQKELAAFKEEAVATLVRVKGIFDLKINETQKSFLVQAKKIQDLEALLAKSKNTIESLEMDLKNVKEKMNMAMGTVKAPNDGIGMMVLYDHEDLKMSSQSDPTSHCSDFQLNHQLPSADKRALSHKQSSSTDCCHENSPGLLLSEHLGIVSPQNDYFCGPVADSINTQVKEPDLVRAGRKQRIRAFEQNTLTQDICDMHVDQFLSSSCTKDATVKIPQIVSCDIGKSVFNADTNKQLDVTPAMIPTNMKRKQRKRTKHLICKSGLAQRSSTAIHEIEKIASDADRKKYLEDSIYICKRKKRKRRRPLKAMHGTVTTPHNLSCDIEATISNADKLGDVAMADSNTDAPRQPDATPLITSSFRFSKSKKRRRRKNKRLKDLDKIIVHCNFLKSRKNPDHGSNVTHYNVSPANPVECDASLLCQNEERPLGAEVKLLDNNVRVDIAYYKEKAKASESPPLVLKSSQNCKIQDLRCIDKASTHIASSDAVEKPSIKINPEKMNVYSGNPDLVSARGSLLNQTTSNRFLKYTFKRKRKRGTLSTVDQATISGERMKSLGNDLALQKTNEPSTLRASSCDSPRIAQVARQLICLSQKQLG